MAKRLYEFPEIVEKSEDEIKNIIAVVKKSSLPEELSHFVVKCIETAMWLPLILEKKNISLSRLRKMIFGKGFKRSKKRQSKINKDVSENKNLLDPEINSSSLSSNTPELTKNTEKTKKPGHGRMPHSVYKNCEEVRLQLFDLIVGDDCPSLCGGRLGAYTPGFLIRIKGQNFATVSRYTIEKLRCNLCGIILSARIPSEVGNDKYDATFKAMLALMKYYVAIPFYRQEYLQRMLDFPLSDATQWHLIEQLAGDCYAPFNELKHESANGCVMYNDDTRLVILEELKKIKAENSERTGMYTTGVVVETDNHQIALFLNGRQHSGENLADLLKQRKIAEPIIQMCDALSANVPKGLETILCNCLSHGVRKFDDLIDFYPEECVTIIKALGAVFKHDEDTKTMSKDARLSYHQQHSAPIMDQLYVYLITLISEHLIEPNSELGKAIKYMIKHWKKLIRFLSVAGAPIENNICERALKIPIRNRKSAMFYRTNYSAQIGGMITSLIYTCHLAKENPLHYLTALQEHREAVSKKPSQWLPWNYQQTMQKVDANPMVNLKPSDHLAAA